MRCLICLKIILGTALYTQVLVFTKTKREILNNSTYFTFIEKTVLLVSENIMSSEFVTRSLIPRLQRITKSVSQAKERLFFHRFSRLATFDQIFCSMPMRVADLGNQNSMSQVVVRTTYILL